MALLASMYSQWLLPVNKTNNCSRGQQQQQQKSACNDDKKIRSLYCGRKGERERNERFAKTQ
jgi:hypothetical protein